MDTTNPPTPPSQSIAMEAPAEESGTAVVEATTASVEMEMEMDVDAAAPEGTDAVELLLNISHAVDSSTRSEMVAPEAVEVLPEAVQEQVPEPEPVPDIADLEPISAHEPEPEPELEPEPKRKRKRHPTHYLGEDNTIIRCICGFTEDDGFTIQCEGCGAWEHGMCFGFNDVDSAPDQYLCELCDPRPVDKEGARRIQLRMIEQQRLAREAGAKIPGAGEKPRSKGGKRRKEQSNPVPEEGGGEMGPPAKPRRGRQQSNKSRTKAPVEPSSPAIGDDYFKIDPWTMEYTPIEQNIPRGLPVRRVLRQMYKEWIESLPEQEKEREDDLVASHLPSPTETGLLRLSPDAIFPPPNYSPLAPPLPPVFLTAPSLSSLAPSLIIKPVPSPSSSSGFTTSFLPPTYRDHLTMRAIYTRPTVYGVFTPEFFETGTFLGEYLGELIDPAAYRQDPINQYTLLGVPKPHVHALGPPINLMIDARNYGSPLRFVRNGCHPNAVIRPIVWRTPSSSSSSSSSSSEGTPKIAFGLFTSRSIPPRAEIILGWEWDDQHLVHSLPLIHPTSSPSTGAVTYPNWQKNLLKGQAEELGWRYERLLGCLWGVFAGCGCASGGAGGKGENKGPGSCALEQMMEFWRVTTGRSNLKPQPSRVVTETDAEGEGEAELDEDGEGEDREKERDMAYLGPLVGSVRGWRNRELEVESVKQWGAMGASALPLLSSVDVDIEMRRNNVASEKERENKKSAEEERRVSIDSQATQEEDAGEEEHEEEKMDVDLLQELSEPESERRPHAHTEEGEEDGDSEADFANAEVSMDVHQMEDGVEEDKGALSDATTITLPRRGRSPSLSSLGSTDDSDDVSRSDSENSSLESEDEGGDEDERVVINARKMKKKVVPSSPPLLPSKSKLNQPRLHSHPRPKSKDRVKPSVKDRGGNKVQPKSGKSLSSPSDNHHVKAKAKRRDLSQAQSSRQRPDSSLSSIKDREKPGKKSVPVGIGAGLKGSKKRTKRIVSSSETEEDEVRVKKKLKEKEKKTEQKPSLPSAVNSEGAAPEEATPPPKSPRPLTPPPPLSFLPVKEPSPPPASASEPKEPTPPPPEPPKKVSLSEYLKTHKFRKESQTPTPVADRGTSGSDSAAGSIAIPGLGDHLPPRSLSASADASKTEPVEHEKREESNPPNPLVPTNTSANVATSASTSGLNLFEHLPSSRGSASGSALGLGSGDNSGLSLVNASGPLSVVESSPAPVSVTKNLDENDPLSSSAIATALSLASAITSATSRGQIVNHEASTGATRPAMQSSTSTSYVPRQSQPQAQSTPSSATVSLPIPTSTSKDHFIHPLPLTPSIPPPLAPSSAATAATRVSSSYTPRQVSSSSITSVGGVEESHSPQRGFTPLYGRRERERSPIRGDFRDRDRDRDWNRDRDRDRRPLTLSHRELPERPSTSTSISIPPPLTARDLPPHTSSALSGTPSESAKTTALGLGLPRAPPTGPKVPPTGPRAFSGSGAPGGGVETAASPSAAGALGGIGAGLGLSRGRGFRGFAPRGVWRGRGFRGRGRGG
ncbi:hypothetical protein I307_03878 [Cryptococcus deuterogattii 99/473]|uniref:Histone deacetylation-related protein n=1 Tax=Cryptococcus deuterogattii Ram5 TaxID=1296110 RepID=A0A0D0UUU7_9TREE|nr:hypothetical protein I313_06260 [Cryptococcus deuterogattii Ram5]KIR70108.1 hypothetical protein I310_06091 [Cryptococcus deuterogattii CA1014]KIY56769.1 hypothetical protein I307_03878 [Cryptococcus deuterogattii 99/473]